MTLTELARLAYVSPSTASKAFALSPEVNEQTRNMIFEIAKKNGCFKKFYRSEYPGLVFAVICPEFESTYYAAFIAEMQKYLAKYSCEVAVAATGFDEKTEERLIEYYERYHTVDGIILINGFFRHTLKSEIPIATINCGGNGTINVSKSMKSCIAEMLKKWKSVGVHEIGYIGEPYTGGRLDILKEALADASMEKDETLFVVSPERFERGGYLGALELLSRGRLPRAILCAYDRIAIGAMRAFSEKGIRVPEDVAILGVDDAPFSHYTAPSLSSVSHKIEQTCENVARALMALITGTHFESNIEVHCELIERESSRITEKQ